MPCTFGDIAVQALMVAACLLTGCCCCCCCCLCCNCCCGKCRPDEDENDVDIPPDFDVDDDETWANNAAFNSVSMHTTDQDFSWCSRNNSVDYIVCNNRVIGSRDQHPVVEKKIPSPHEQITVLVMVITI